MAKTAEKSAIREFRAEARFQRTSPQKAKLVLDMIKGQSVENALNTLMFARKRIAPVVEKALRSAVTERQLPEPGTGLRSGHRSPVCEAGSCQRGPAYEAHPACPNGACIPLPAPSRAHHCDGCGEGFGRCFGIGCSCRGCNGEGQQEVLSGKEGRCQEGSGEESRQQEGRRGSDCVMNLAGLYAGPASRSI